MRIIVIPDIHGRHDALTAILRHCGAVDRALGWAHPDFTVVQLGDLIDRGPKVRACVELMMGLQEEAGNRLIVLKGNHEDLLLSSVDSSRNLPLWLVNGAQETLESYGKDFDRLCRPGGAHHRWFSSLPVSWTHARVLFVHGGLSKKNLKKMDPEKLMWDRPPLVRGDFQALVCGHTPTPSGKVEMEDNIFRCDLGLGMGRESALEYLQLDFSGESLSGWKVRTAD